MLIEANSVGGLEKQTTLIQALVNSDQGEGFDFLFQDAKENPPKNIKKSSEGALTFKQEAEPELNDITLEDRTKRIHRADERKEERGAGSDAEKKGKEPVVEEKSQSQGIETRGLHPGFLVNLKNIDNTQLLNKLSPELRQFADDTAEVLKKYDPITKTFQYEFNFKNVPLNITISKVDGVVEIHVHVHENANDVMDEFTRYKGELVKRLESEFEHEEIKVEISSGSQQESQDQSESHDQDDAQPQDHD